VSTERAKSLRTDKKIAVVHDWLTGMRGGEYVLEAILELLPNATVFTLVYFPEKISEKIKKQKIVTSWMSILPRFLQERYRLFLPVLPWFIERLDLSSYDLVISSSHCVAKGVRKPKNAVHISYVHAPMRYIWDRFDDYFGPARAKPLIRTLAKFVRPILKRWDYRVSQSDRVDGLIANSRFISELIQKNYGRDALVIYPFCDFDFFSSYERKPGNYYLIVSAFAPYKRIDLAVEAAKIGGFPLKIVGTGQDEARLKKSAAPNIEFLGSRSRSEIAELYANCKALLFPGVEDFGITPLEAMATGAPVIAYKEGGVCETVTEETGVFFEDQTVSGLLEGIRVFERDYDPIQGQAACKKRAKEFSKQRFQSQFLEYLQNYV
jgi:glycosyltransferase involved in cell wall biosynthesis